MNIFSTRKATIEDAAAIARLTTELGYPTSEQQCFNRLKGLLQIPEHRVIVACDALNIAVGWIHVFISYGVESDPFAEIGGLVIAQAYRQNSLGSMLISEAEKWVRKSGVGKLRVRSRVERKEALSFYLKKGFNLYKQQNVLDKKMGNVKSPDR